MNLVPRLIAAVACTLASASATAAAVTAPVGIASAEPAVVYNWATGTGFWSASSSWQNAVVPQGSPGAILRFNSSLAGGTAINNLPANPFVANRLEFDSSGFSATVSGSQLRLSGTTPAITQSGAGAINLGFPLDIAAPVTFGGDGTGIVTLNGTLSGGAGIRKTGTSTFRIGSAALTTPSDNTFHGGFTLTDGVLGFSNAVVTARTAMRANRITFESAGALLIAASELRSGELVGSGGSVVGLGEVSPFDGQNILLYPYGDGNFGGAVRTVSAGGEGSNSGTLTIRGCANQTLSGTVDVNEIVTVAHGSTLTLGGTASLQSGTATTISFNGGTLVLDNRAVNNNDRLRDTAADLAQLDLIGGGTLSLIGNAAGTQETTGSLELGSATNERSGAMTVNVTHTAGKNAATVLSLLNLSRDDADAPHSTIDFTAQDGNGKPLTLGLAGNNPRILFLTAPVLNNGLLAPSSAVPDPTAPDPTAIMGEDQVGWATVNGSHFATYGPAGIAPVATIPFPRESSGKKNALLTGNGTISPATPFSLNSLRIAPAAANQHLWVTGAGTLRTNAVLLAGARDYSITNSGKGTGGWEGRGGSRYVFVQEAVLTLGLNLGLDDGLTKSGGGTLALTHPANASLAKALTINAGTVRGTPGSTLPGGRIELRGGVLEIAGGGIHGFTLGLTGNHINWRGGATSLGESQRDKGSGGFSAFGEDATVVVYNDKGASVSWEEPYFVDSNHALIFGSRRADHGLTFASELKLNGASKTVNFNAREIRVIDNPASTRDFARISGRIVGPQLADLMKVGDGILDLTADNSTFMGGMFVAEGTLSTSDPHGLGADKGAYVLLGMRSGTASSALLTSHTFGTLHIGREITVQAGTTGAAILGNSIAPDATTAGDAVFSGRIALGTTGSSESRPVRLHAEAGTTVTFSGPIETAPGYLGTMNLETTGQGTVIFAGANKYSGSTTITRGGLQAGGVEVIPATSRLSLAAGTSFSLNGFPQNVGSLVGQGTVDLAGGSLGVGGDLTDARFDGRLTGAGLLTKAGAGRWVLAGNTSDFTGTATVSGGTLVLANTAGSATGSAGMAINATGTLEGTGSISGSLAVGSGGTLSPGNGVGKITTGSTTYYGGSTLEFQVKDATAPQPGTGADLHRVLGTLDFKTTPGSPLTVNVTGLDKFNAEGAIAHFVPGNDYAWVIASASGGITGFDPASVVIRTDHFTSRNAIGGGTFSVAQRGGDLVLFFTGAPIGGAGTYSALIAGETHDTSGYLRLATTRTGTFSGALKFAGENFVLRGKFNASGNFGTTIRRSGNQAGLTVTLHLDPATNRITGQVNDGAVDHGVTARRSIYRVGTSPLPEAGSYTVLLPADPAHTEPVYPQGTGYAVLTAAAGGEIKATGKLADGTPFSLGAVVDDTGAVPLYLELYPGRTAPRGSLRGVLQFEDKPGVSDLHGLLAWDRPNRTGSVPYVAGFTTTTQLLGSRYRVPAARTAALALTAGKVEFGKGNLPEFDPINIVLAPSNIVTVTDTPNAHLLRMTLAARTGLFSGSVRVQLPSSSAFSGVLFQKQNLGAGFIMQGGQSSSVKIGP